MSETTVSLADAKARLSELTELAAGGEEVVITKRGKPVVRLSPADEPRRRVALDVLRRLTDRMPKQGEGAGKFMRRVRDESRY